MRIDNTIRVFETNNDKNKSFNKKTWSAPSRCLFCGSVLKEIDNSNVKVCVNKYCERGRQFYKLT